MMRALARLPRMGRDERGSMAIETAFVAPVLLMLALGGFEVSQMVARQTELQSAAAEAAAVVRAVAPESDSERATVRDIVATSLCGNTDPTVTDGAATCGTTSVRVNSVFRCGSTTSYTTDESACSGGVTNEYIQIRVTDSYVPIWANYGIGSGFDYDVDRTVLVGSETGT